MTTDIFLVGLACLLLTEASVCLVLAVLPLLRGK